MDGGLQIDRILHGEAIGRPGPVRARISIADHPAVEGCDQMGKSAIHHQAKAPRHLGQIGRDQLEGCGAVQHRVLVDFGDGGKVGGAAGPDFERGHGREGYLCPCQKKSPGRKAGAWMLPMLSGQSRWPSNCSSSVNRLMKFRYSDSAPVMAARSATSPPC